MHESSAAAGTVSGTVASQQIEQFAARLRSRWRRAQLGEAALRAVLPFLLVVLLLLWWRPMAAAAIGVGAAVVVLVVLLIAALRARSASPLAAFGDLAQLDRGRMLTDELATWIEVGRRARPAGATADAPMVAWLGEQIANELPQISAAELQRVGRRRLGRLRYLLPLLVLLALAWLLLHLLPPIPGLLGGAGVDDGGGLAGAQQGGGAAGAGTGADQRPDLAGRLPLPPPEPLPEPTPEPSAPPEPPPPEPPAPVLDLPAQDNLIVPQFVGDGEVRKALARTALLDVGGAAAQQQQQRAAGTGPAEPPPAQPTTEEFRRAAERAEAARHVPPEEAPMVQRFFRRLREAAK